MIVSFAFTYLWFNHIFLFPSSKTVDTPHSHSHSHGSQVNNEPVVRFVSRNRAAIAQHFAAPVGPFAVRAAGGTPIFIDPSLDSGFAPFRSAVVPAAPANQGEHSLFQTADGRIFALSTAANTIQPGN